MDEALIRLQEEELQRTGRYYKHICFLCVPLLCVSCYLYGLRPLLLCGFAVLMGNLCDRLISLLRRRVYQAGDYSNESFALVITLLMPATVDWYVLAAAILAGALIGKEVFGGYGSYPFHPAAVGYAVAAVSWPEQVFRYPAPYANIPLWDASGVATSSTISDTLRSGGLINISALSLVLGEYAAPMGTGAAIVLVACGLFLWMQKDVRLSASLSFLITAGLIVFFFPRQLGLTEGTAFTAGLVFRLRCVRDEMLTGAMLFSAVFLLNEPYTCAHHRLGRILYGVMVGAFTMGFRYFGVYETGVCFAILAVNSISGWLDRTEVRLRCGHIQHHLGHPAQRRPHQHQRPVAGAGRVCRPDGDRCSHRAGSLRPLPLDAEGCAAERLPEFPHHGGPHRLLLPAPAGSDGGDRLYGGPCVPPALCARRDADGRDALQRRLPAQ